MSLSGLLGHPTTYTPPVLERVEIDIPVSSLYSDEPAAGHESVSVNLDGETTCCDELSSKVDKYRDLIALIPFVGTGIGIHRIYKELKAEVVDKWEVAKGFTELFSFAILPNIVLAIVYAVKAIIAKYSNEGAAELPIEENPESPPSEGDSGTDPLPLENPELTRTELTRTELASTEEPSGEVPS
jgi:hypothetical protein